MKHLHGGIFNTFHRIKQIARFIKTLYSRLKSAGVYVHVLVSNRWQPVHSSLTNMNIDTCILKIVKHALEWKKKLNLVYIFDNEFLFSCSDNIPQTTSLRHTWRLPAFIWRRILYRPRLILTGPLSSRRTPRTRSFRSTTRYVRYTITPYVVQDKCVVITTTKSQFMAILMFLSFVEHAVSIFDHV